MLAVCSFTSTFNFPLSLSPAHILEIQIQVYISSLSALFCQLLSSCYKSVCTVWWNVSLLQAYCSSTFVKHQCITFLQYHWRSLLAQVWNFRMWRGGVLSKYVYQSLNLSSHPSFPLYHTDIFSHSQRKQTIKWSCC